ncbi:MAG: hypothetical protein MOIL_01787 [Candidatus Methanolliviera sp. GoM_oil]|nr:MAG: hypothetical protein MOIL_01787 [Candidatus Methanolliviera sp. GoM_oil]
MRMIDNGEQQSQLPYNPAPKFFPSSIGGIIDARSLKGECFFMGIIHSLGYFGGVGGSSH